MSEPAEDSLHDDLLQRLRDAAARPTATEQELRALGEQAAEQARALAGRIAASESRIRELEADEHSSLAELAQQLRLAERLRDELALVSGLLGRVDQRVSELRPS